MSRRAPRVFRGSTASTRTVVYDVNGRRVKMLVDQRMKAGFHSLIWDGTNNDGLAVGSGVYWAQMHTGVFESTKKMIVLK